MAKFQSSTSRTKKIEPKAMVVRKPFFLGVFLWRFLGVFKIGVFIVGVFFLFSRNWRFFHGVFFYGSENWRFQFGRFFCVFQKLAFFSWRFFGRFFLFPFSRRFLGVFVFEFRF